MVSARISASFTMTCAWASASSICLRVLFAKMNLPAMMPMMRADTPIIMYMTFWSMNLWFKLFQNGSFRISFHDKTATNPVEIIATSEDTKQSPLISGEVEVVEASLFQVLTSLLFEVALQHAF